MKKFQQSCGRLKRVRKSFASDRNEQILKPNAFVNRFRNEAFRRVSRSAGSQTKFATTVDTGSLMTDQTSGFRTVAASK